MLSSERSKQHCVCLVAFVSPDGSFAIRIINREANYAELITRNGEAYYCYTDDYYYYYTDLMGYDCPIVLEIGVPGRAIRRTRHIAHIHASWPRDFAFDKTEH